MNIAVVTVLVSSITYYPGRSNAIFNTCNILYKYVLISSYFMVCPVVHLVSCQYVNRIEMLFVGFNCYVVM